MYIKVSYRCICIHHCFVGQAEHRGQAWICICAYLLVCVSVLGSEA